MTRDPASAGRCAAFWTAASLLGGIVAAWWLGDLRAAVAAPPAATDVAGWLVVGCEAVALVAGGWLWLLVSLLTLDAARAAGPRRGVPRWLARAVLAACGAGLVAGLTGPAYAASPAPPSSPLAGLPLPTGRRASRLPGRAARLPQTGLPTPLAATRHPRSSASSRATRCGGWSRPRCRRTHRPPRSTGGGGPSTRRTGR